MHGLPKKKTPKQQTDKQNKRRTNKLEILGRRGGSRDAEKKLGSGKRGWRLTVVDREADDESVRMRL